MKTAAALAALVFASAATAAVPSETLLRAELLEYVWEPCGAAAAAMLLRRDIENAADDQTWTKAQFVAFLEDLDRLWLDEQIATEADSIADAEASMLEFEALDVGLDFRTLDLRKGLVYASFLLACIHPVMEEMQ